MTEMRQKTFWPIHINRVQDFSNESKYTLFDLYKIKVLHSHLDSVHKFKVILSFKTIIKAREETQPITKQTQEKLMLIPITIIV